MSRVKVTRKIFGTFAGYLPCGFLTLVEISTGGSLHKIDEECLYFTHFLFALSDQNRGRTPKPVRTPNPPRAGPLVGSRPFIG